jgi:hypothetical protein
MSALRIAIYEPPAPEFPFLVVAKHDDECQIIPTKTRKEARAIASARRQKEHKIAVRSEN